jgi:hypothetical protein
VKVRGRPSLFRLPLHPTEPRRPAFCVHAKDVARDGIRDALAAEVSAFERWLDGTETGVLFADAIDELHLIQKTLADFFRRLQEGLRRKKARLLLVMTTRPSAWTLSERQMLSSMLLSMRERSADNHAPEIQELTFERLGYTDIDSLVGAFAPGDSAVISAAFRESEMADFTDLRPLDVRRLVEHWKQHRTL